MLQTPCLVSRGTHATICPSRGLSFETLRWLSSRSTRPKRPLAGRAPSREPSKKPRRSTHPRQRSSVQQIKSNDRAARPTAQPTTNVITKLDSAGSISAPCTVFSFLPSPPNIHPPVASRAESPPSEQLSRSEALFTSRPAKFLYSAPRFLHHPVNTHIPEVALLGRSNVGKSTLINALSGLGGKRAGQSHGAVGNRSGIAVTSATAGCTKMMNAYGFGPPKSVIPLSKEERRAIAISEGLKARAEKRKQIKEPPPQYSMILMDMPGYGLNSRADWGAEILKYLGKRKALKGAVLLIDATAGLKDGDRMVLETLRDADVKTSIVMTKADKLLLMGSGMGDKKLLGTPEGTAKLCEVNDGLRKRCLDTWAEIRHIEKGGESGWHEGAGWDHEFAITGAGDPKSGGFGVAGARVAIARLAGLVDQAPVEVESLRPELLTFDALALSEVATATLQRVRAPKADSAPPRVDTQERLAAVPSRGRVRPWKQDHRPLTAPITTLEGLDAMIAANAETKKPLVRARAMF